MCQSVKNDQNQSGKQSSMCVTDVKRKSILFSLLFVSSSVELFCFFLFFQINVTTPNYPNLAYTVGTRIPNHVLGVAVQMVLVVLTVKLQHHLSVVGIIMH